MTSLDDLPIFDHSRALQLLDGDEELVVDVIELFQSTAKGIVDDLRAAADASDFDAIGSKAHSLKGAAGNIAAERLRHLAERLEKDAKAGAVEELGTRIDEIATHLEDFGREVVDFV